MSISAYELFFRRAGIPFIVTSRWSQDLNKISNRFSSKAASKSRTCHWRNLCRWCTLIGLVTLLHGPIEFLDVTSPEPTITNHQDHFEKKRKIQRELKITSTTTTADAPSTLCIYREFVQKGGQTFSTYKCFEHKWNFDIAVQTVAEWVSPMRCKCCWGWKNWWKKNKIKRTINHSIDSLKRSNEKIKGSTVNAIQLLRIKNFCWKSVLRVSFLCNKVRKYYKRGKVQKVSKSVFGVEVRRKMKVL